jgi:pilus assembly protein CpaE
VNTIKALVALDSDIDRYAVESVLPAGPDVDVVGLVDGLEEAWTVLQESAVDVLVVACAGYSDRALFLVEGAVRQQPDRPVLVLSAGSPNGFVRRVFEVGADDILTLPLTSDDVRFALQKAIARRQGTAGATGVALAPMICVLGPKGGTGKTLTSCNLSVALANGGQERVVLVDLDLQFGDVGLALGLNPETTIHDLAKSSGSLDAEKVEDYLVQHSSGVRVLLAPVRPDHAGVVTVEFLRELYTILRSMADYVIVDTPPGFTPEVIASIDSSSHIVMVGMLDSLSLKNTKLGLETLELMGYKSERVRIVLNRADSRVGITHDDVVAIVGRPPDVLVPSEREISRSVNEAVPIVQRKEGSEAARAFRVLAELYQDGHGPAEQNGAPQRRLSLRRKG